MASFSRRHSSTSQALLTAEHNQPCDVEEWRRLKDAICYHANCSQLLHDEQSGSVAWGLCEVERVAKVECYQLEGRSLRHHNRSCAPAPAKACNDRGRAGCDRCDLTCTVAGAGYGGDGG